MCVSDTGCFLTWHPGIIGHPREFGIGRRGDYFDVTSERSDRQADISKNIRDVSKPETLLLLPLLLLSQLRARRRSSAQSSWLWICPLRVWMNVTHLFRQRRVSCDLQPAEGKKPHQNSVKVWERICSCVNRPVGFFHWGAPLKLFHQGENDSIHWYLNLENNMCERV